MRDHTRLLSPMLVVVALIVSAVAFPYLPALVPIHWVASGQADQFAGRIEFAFSLPLLMLGLWLFLSLAPRYDRLLFVRYEVRAADSAIVRPVYHRMIMIFLIVILAAQVLEVASAVGWIPGGQERTFAIVLSIGMIAVGNSMPTVTRRNAFVGVRLPWAFASEDVWRRTQRASGYGMVAAGVIGLVGAMVVHSAFVKVLMAALLVQVVAVLVYSFSLARADRARGGIMPQRRVR